MISVGMKSFDETIDRSGYPTRELVQRALSAKMFALVILDYGMSEPSSRDHPTSGEDKITEGNA